MRILLINPNHFNAPPAPPLALEYLRTGLTEAGYESDVLDLCFKESIDRHIDEAFQAHTYEVTGITFRNLDSAVYHTNTSYLEDLKKVVASVKRHDTKVVLGGAGFSIAPRELIAATGAHYGIIGPGEEAFTRLVEDIHSYDAGYSFLNGADYPDYRYQVHERGVCCDYPRYMKAGALAGFETHKGCGESCPFCTEAKTSVVYREPECVVEEILQLAKSGIKDLHLCDSEFNQDEKQAIRFCELLTAAPVHIRWALYMKPVPHSPELFRVLAASGAHLVTLSVDSWSLHNRYTENDVLSFIAQAKKAGIRVAVDLLIGLPRETEEVSRAALDLFRKERPDTVGVNTYIRLYKYTRTTAMVNADPSLAHYLKGPGRNDPDYLIPVFYNHIPDKTLREWAGDDSLFLIEGLEQATNYQRLKKN